MAMSPPRAQGFTLILSLLVTSDAFLLPASPRRILLRMCSNLHQVYQRNGKSADAMRIQGYIVALSK